MLLELLKAMLVGIIAAVPVGPVLVMTLQRTLCNGKTVGMMTGLGSALGDTVYAAIGMFTLGVIQQFVDANQSVILILGSVLVGLIGINIFFTNVSVQNVSQPRRKATLIGYSLQTMGGVLSNPAALAVMLGLFSAFGLGSDDRISPIWLAVLMVGLGEFLYWLLIVYVVARFVKLRERTLRIVSKSAGVIIMVFAAVLLVRGISIL